ncbi:MAG: hypothetical protein EHM45_00425 [Desulfobacteraceae bacterium]|nr:MAG: hypothetical protein EHM45_00425 [Desulfobacteraceae bacterium]
MNKTHFTLRPSTNIVLIMLWGTIAVALFFLCNPHPILIAGVGALLGLVGGIMQTLSFRQARDSFLDTKTMLEVRAKLKSTMWGKRYLHYLWASNIFLVILSFSFSSNPALAILTGFFSLMFIREIITLKQTFESNRLQYDKKAQ